MRFLGSLATIAIGVPTVTFGSLTYWDTLTTPDIAEAVNPTCTPDVYGIVENGVRYVVEEFTTVETCDWTVPTGVTQVEALIVAGGGGGGSSYDGPAAGGGGAGGVIHRHDATLLSVTPATSMTVVVGAGGAGGAGTGGGIGDEKWQVPGTDGGNSALGDLLAIGGGGGAGRAGAGRSGGSGGGAGGRTLQSGGAATGGQGSTGGGTEADFRAGGGGGGASATGGVGTSTPGLGGAGTTLDISGTATTYATGGDGGVYQGSRTVADSGTSPGDGGGGGDGRNGGVQTGVGGSGGAGADGIVIVRYEVPGSNSDFAIDLNSDGTGTDYLEANGDVIPTGSTTFTVEAWVYDAVENDTGYVEFFSQGAAATALYLGTVAGSQELRAGDSWPSTGVDMPTDQWVHLALSVDSGTATLYLNGHIAATSSGYAGSPPGGSPFRVGEQYCGGTGGLCPEPMSGLIDEIKVWSDARSEAEIRAGMHTAPSGTDLTDGSLRAYWDFNQSSGTTVTALGSLGATATLTAVGSPTFTELAVADTASRSGWTIHEFERSYITAAGGWTVPPSVSAAEVLVVGGGGGGGGTGSRSFSGGGGAGGSVTENPNHVVVPGTAVPVTVGAGGQGGSASSNTERPGEGGQSSFGATTAEGGGRGGHSVDTSYTDASSPTGGSRNGGGGGAQASAQSGALAGSSEYRSGGDGAGSSTTSAQAAGGGAGAEENGSDGTSAAGGVGGRGTTSSITGSTYGGGGGGGRRDSSGSAGSGGAGGGGAGGKQADGIDGTAGSGGGGGGAGGSAAAGGNGGSGVVVVAYPMCVASAVQSVTIGGIDYRYQEFTTPDTDASDGSHNGDLACAGSWTTPSGVTSVDVLVVGGGGGGGANGADSITGGGGGAGGLRYDTIATTPGDAVTVNVGSGGDGAIWGTDNAGGQGAGSRFGALATIGGGGGGSLSQSGTSGGSGGGNGYPYGASTSVGAGTAGQGSNGEYFASGNTGGNGGGASGNGKAGVASSITGTQTTYATGGGPAVTHETLTVALEAGSGNGGNAGYDYAAGIDHGQAGSSGTVIVRWTADPADALPVIDLYARYRAGDYDATTKIWTDSSGNGRHTLASAVNGSPALTTSTAANGSSTTFPIVTGGTTDSVAFPSGVLPADYTLFHLARYGGATRQQIISASNTNWLSGFWDGKSGVAYQANSVSGCAGACWITQNSQSVHGTNWVVSSDQKQLYRSQSVDRTSCQSCSTVSSVSLTINRPNSTYSAQASGWEVADLLVFDRRLAANELRAVEAHLGRAFGVEMPGLQATGVTGARVAGSGTTSTVTWNAPSDVTATGYTIEQSDDDGATWATASFSGSADPVGTTITGLTAGTSYRFRVLAAVSEITNGVVSASSAAITTAETSSTTLTWSPSSPIDTDSITLTANVTAGGSPVAGATVAFTNGATTITGCGAVTTDANGEATCSWGTQAASTISVTATATDDAIITSSDTQSITITAGTPGQPTGLTATANGTGRVVLTWSAPASGASPTDYVVEYRLTGSTSWFEWNPSTSTSTSETVTGLGSSDDYDFRVTATASGSSGTPSAIATVTTSAGAIVKQFTSGTTTWKVPSGLSAIEYLVVAGGGGGGGGQASEHGGGGGGGGGVVTGSINNPSASSYSITVGNGGAGGGTTSGSGLRGSNGQNSSISGVATAIGGGGGGSYFPSSTTPGSGPPLSGGSGGGGANSATSTHRSGASGTSGQGYAGGSVSSAGVAGRHAAGGGGAGGSGGSEQVTSETSTGAGAGGIGKLSSISGSSTRYGGGGGGGGYTGGSGGSGGGGAGGSCQPNCSVTSAGTGTNGTSGRGGGGGGGMGTGGATARAGGAGGRGIVILRHAPAGTSMPDLVAGSDTGSSSSDDVTGDTTPTFTGVAQYGATVQLYVDDGTGAVASGSTCSVNSSTYVWTCTTGTLVDDDYDITAVATFTDVSGTTLKEMSSPLSVTIDSALSIDAITLNDATVNSAYTATITATGGIAPITWTLTSGALPTGVTFSTAGVISGTPTVTGDFTFTVTATDSNSPTVTDSLALTLTVNTITQTLAFTSSDTATWGDTITITATRGPSGQPVVFTVTDGTATGCTITSTSDTTGTLTATSAGTCTITANQAGNATHAAAPEITQTLTIERATQTITFTDPADTTWSTTPIAINPTSDSGLTVTVTSSTTDVCTISAGTPGLNINLLKAGTCTLTASQTGNTNYLPATNIEHTINIAKVSETISFTLPSSTSNVTYGADTIGVSGSVPSGRLLTYTSSDESVCTVTGDATVSNGTATNATVSIVGAGTCTLTASRTGDDRYNDATDVARSFTVAKAAQRTLSITSSSDVVWGDWLSVAAAGGSGTGAVTFGASAGTAGCSINATTGALTFTSAGTCSVTADKAGDGNYLAAGQATQSVTIAKASQTVSFTSTVPANPRPGGTYSPTATSSSGLTPTLTITAGQPSVCTLSSGEITFLTTGTCTVSAAQSGDSRFSAAASQSQTISVGALNQTITVESIDDVGFGAPAFTLDTEATSGLVVTATSTDSDVCTVSGLVVTPVDIGTCEISLAQAGDARYAAASSVSISFRILAALPTAPSIVSVSGGNGEITIGFTAPGFTGGVPVDAYEITASPTSGDDIVDRSCTDSPCTIAGLVNGTSYTLTVAAINTAGTGPASELSPSVTPATRATAVRQLNATPGNGTMRVAWSAPADLGGGTFTRYELRIAPDGDAMPDDATATVTSSASGSYTFAGLDNGVAYNVEIVTITTANQQALTGNTATLSSVPVTTPSAPTELTINSINPRQITIAWSEPLRDGGATVTGYTATITDSDSNTVDCGTIDIDATSRSATCTSEQLELSTAYTVTVAAVNRIGAGPVATAVHTTPTFTAPTTPPITTDGELDPEVDCPCILDQDGNPTPVDTDTTAVGRIPGQTTIAIGTGTIIVGGRTISGGATTWVDANGNLVAQTPGTIPATGSGALPGTTVTIFLNGTLLGTATVAADGTWSLNLALPAGTSGPINLSFVWIDENGTQNTLVVPITVNASGDAASAPRAPAGGAQLTPDPDSALALGPNGELVDSTRSSNPEANSITVIADDTTIVITPAENGQVATNGRLTLTHPARVRVTGDGMLPGATATVWIKSDPQRLGTATITDDGLLDATFAVPTSIDPGNHTIQIDTTDPDGEALTLALGLTITTGLLPTTGTNTNVNWMILFIALGGLVALTTGNRRRELR